MSATEDYEEGCNYFYGVNGYPLDYHQAFVKFTEAAAGNISNAMNNLGIMYMDGKGVPQDYSNSFEWLNRALQADGHNYLAYHNLARLYYNGFGVQKSVEKAYNCYMRAVKFNPQRRGKVFVDDCFTIGFILVNNYNSLREAFPYFKEAAFKGNKPEAWHNLGYICSQKGIPGANRQTGFQYFLKAAELGYAPSMYEVGCVYISNNMVDEGISWVEKAAIKGHEPARKNLKRFKAARRATQTGSVFDLLGFFDKS